ncbi:Transposase family Tnp2 protein [Ceratobasidium sp. AG-Ba]|nr:Transposase family Tnp2 protein [Ceratobasidium sp. AG-Ba]
MSAAKTTPEPQWRQSTHLSRLAALRENASAAIVLGPRQLARHLTRFLARLDLEIADAQAAGQLDEFNDPDDSDDEQNLAGHGMDLGDAMEVEGDLIPNLGEEYDHAVAGADMGAYGQALKLVRTLSPPMIPSPRLLRLGAFMSLCTTYPFRLKTGPNQISRMITNPPFDEQLNQPAQGDFDPIHEPDMADGDVHAIMRLELGDLAEQEWIELYDKTLTAKDRNTFRFLATRLRTHFSRQTYDELRYGVCQSLRIPSEFVAYRRLRIMAGFATRTYDCCVNSCCCFLGKHSECQICPFCKEPRYTNTRRARRSFYYSPLIPQLQALYRSPDMLEKIQCRSNVENASEEGVYEDVYDGEHYRRLRNTQLNPGDPYKILDKPEDLALGLSTDGFTLFKRRRRGLSTAWPIIFINYNLHPRYRVRLENIICVGVIPGPKQCKDLNSFLIPVLEELLLLERGVTTPKRVLGDATAGRVVDFVLRAFLIMVFGDIPAVSKLLALKGHNARVPCRSCYMQGYLCRLPKNSVYYIPLRHPGHAQGYPPHLLVMRTHNAFLEHYNELDDLADRPGRRKKYAQDFGVNDRPIFARLKSFDLAQCAPYDIRELAIESLSAD